MAITVTKIAENASTSNVSSYPDAESTTPAANKGLVCCIVNAAAPGGAVSSVTAYGATFTEQATVLGSNTRASIWAAQTSGASPSTSQVTVAFAAGQTACIFWMFEIGGMDTTDFTVQAPTGSAASGTTATVTFSALGDSTNNVQLMLIGTASTGDMAVDATGGWTEVGADLNVGSPVTRGMVQYRTGADLTSTATWSGSAAWAAVGLEIKMASTGPTGSGGGDAPVTVTATGDGTRLELGSGGGVASVPVTATGAGTPLEKGTGGGDAAVQVVATGGGSAGVPPTGSGGGVAPVTVTATGGGKEGHSGGGTATVTATAAGGGMWGHTSGGVATVTVTGQGGGKEGHASGGVAGITVTATGGGSGPAPSGSGGSDSPVLVSATGGGTAFVPAGGGSAAVLVAATGGGEGEVGIFTGPWVGTLGVRVDTATVLVEET